MRTWRISAGWDLDRLADVTFFGGSPNPARSDTSSIPDHPPARGRHEPEYKLGAPPPVSIWTLVRKMRPTGTRDDGIL